nr:hypothetical protein [Tanacetum cinerariifolium]
MHAVKRIFRYVKGHPTLGLWYPKDSPLELIAYSDNDYVGASLDRKSTTREKIHVDNESAICMVKNPVYHSKTKHIEIRHHFNRDSYEKRLIEMGIDTCGRPRCQETIGGSSAQTRSGEGRLEENIELMDTIPTPYDSPLTRGYTPRSDEKKNRVVIHSSDEEGPSLHIEDSPKQGRIIEEMDKDKILTWIWDQVYIFVPKDSKIEREVKKRAGFDLQQGSSRKQRLDQQTEEIKEEAGAQAIPLAIRPLVIIEYKIEKEGKISTCHITRADGSTIRYTSMINLLKNIDREDLETLWKLVKDKYGNTRPEEGYERVLWGNLKVMFEPYIKSEVWRQLQGHDITIWKLFPSCGVHFVIFKNLHILLLVDKVYPLTPATIRMMLERKLQADQ